MLHPVYAEITVCFDLCNEPLSVHGDPRLERTDGDKGSRENTVKYRSWSTMMAI